MRIVQDDETTKKDDEFDANEVRGMQKHEQLCLKYGSKTSLRMLVFVVVYFLMELNLSRALSSFFILRNSVEADFDEKPL